MFGYIVLGISVGEWVRCLHARLQPRMWMGLTCLLAFERDSVSVCICACVCLRVGMCTSACAHRVCVCARACLRACVRVSVCKCAGVSERVSACAQRRTATVHPRTSRPPQARPCRAGDGPRLPRGKPSCRRHSCRRRRRRRACSDRGAAAQARAYRILAAMHARWMPCSCARERTLTHTRIDALPRHANGTRTCVRTCS